MTFPLFDGCIKRGIGFSFHQCWHAEWEEKPHGEVQVGVKINPDLSVLLFAPTVETGSGSNHVALAACAEALTFLRISMSDIRRIERVDTDTSLKDAVQTDSAVSLLLAESMMDVAAKVREKIMGLAAGYYQIPPEELDVAEGRIFFRADPEKSVSVKDLLWWHTGDMPEVPIIVTISRKPNPARDGRPLPGNLCGS